MIEKVNLRQVLTIVGIGLAVCFMFSMFGKSSTNIDKLQADTDRSLGAIKAESSIVSVEIERAGTAGSNLGKSLDRINTEINESRGTINDFRERINELKRLVAECQELTSENTAIFERIDNANR